MAKKQRATRVSGNPAKQMAQEASLPAGATLRDWISGARLRTLPLAVAPVVIGAAVAHMVHEFSLALSLLALLVALFLQIGVNYSNDYSDGIKGTDAHRVGPARLTGGGMVNPKRVLLVALICFGLAGVSGIAAVIISGRWLFLIVGVLAIIAAWFYTGGKRPYGYNALGEVMVFIFFGPVATVGTYWLQTSILTQEVWVFGCAVGLLSVAVLIANNIRDIPTDKLAGKRTLAVVIGAKASKALYTLCVVLPLAAAAFYGLVYQALLLAQLSALLLIPAIIIIWAEKSAKELILVLKLTSFATLVYGVFVALAFIG